MLEFKPQDETPFPHEKITFFGHGLTRMKHGLEDKALILNFVSSEVYEQSYLKTGCF